MQGKSPNSWLHVDIKNHIILCIYIYAEHKSYFTENNEMCGRNL